MSCKNRFLFALVLIWPAIIFATSCTFIERSVFINFVKRYIPNGVAQDLWVKFWSVLGLGVVKTYHFAEYAFLLFLVYGVSSRLWSQHPRRKILLCSIGICVLYAISDEWHQTFVPGRGGTWIDVCIDSAGVGSCAAALTLRSGPPSTL